MTRHRIGIDLGGTKIEIVVLAPDGSEALRHRIATPRRDYGGTLHAIAALVREAEARLGVTATVGIGIPGVISPATGLVKNANSTALNGHAFDRDISALLGREVRVENDANCFALSRGDGRRRRRAPAWCSASSSAPAAAAASWWTASVHRGPHRIAGEWGHNPLPWPRPDECPARTAGAACRAAWRPGSPAPLWRATATARTRTTPATIPARAAAGEARAQAALARHADRLARGLAAVINLLDPDVIVLGGGLSNMDHLYTALPKLLPRHVFSDVVAHADPAQPGTAIPPACAAPPGSGRRTEPCPRSAAIA